MKSKLCLIAESVVNFKDGNEKKKYLFVDVKNKPFTGWSEVSERLEDIQLTDTGQFDSETAVEIDITVSEYDGKMRYKPDLEPHLTDAT